MKGERELGNQFYVQQALLLLHWLQSAQAVAEYPSLLGLVRRGHGLLQGPSQQLEYQG